MYKKAEASFWIAEEMDLFQIIRENINSETYSLLIAYIKGAC